MRYAAILALALVACQTPPPPAPPPPQVVTVEVPRIVQRACPDQRPARTETLPSDADIASVPEGDFETLGRMYRAAIQTARAWLALDDVQILGCSGG